MTYPNSVSHLRVGQGAEFGGYESSFEVAVHVSPSYYGECLVDG